MIIFVSPPPPTDKIPCYSSEYSPKGPIYNFPMFVSFLEFVEVCLITSRIVLRPVGLTKHVFKMRISYT